jgi:UDP-N-acetylglucosamine--dolichyl-phosphate N-acetylglucosaminephosphotransferase
MPFFLNFLKSAGIVGEDIMKEDKPVIADMGGPMVVLGFLAGAFFYIGLGIFLYGDLPELIFILASMCTILIITIIGIFDVLTGLLKEREGPGSFEKVKRKGIPAWLYFFIPMPAAIPLAAVKAGVSSMVLPFIGKVELGPYYPLILIPFAVLCCTNATNFLAGFNGLEAGMGFVLHLFLGVFSLHHGKVEAALIALTFASALLAFLRYNWYPAKVFPGDLNYTIGAVCVCVAVLGNIERFAILCFTPWILEAILKASSKFKAESYGVLHEDGTLKPLKKVNHSLTHVVMNLGNFKEYQVSIILILIEAFTCVVSYIITFSGVV